jgi:hypothetical protein
VDVPPSVHHVFRTKDETVASKYYIINSSVLGTRRAVTIDSLKHFAQFCFVVNNFISYRVALLRMGGRKALINNAWNAAYGAER